jgi:hypothetical protein
MKQKYGMKDERGVILNRIFGHVAKQRAITCQTRRIMRSKKHRWTSFKSESTDLGSAETDSRTYLLRKF